MKHFGISNRFSNTCVTIHTIYTMTTESEKTKGWENIKVRNEKRLRLKKVRRELSVKEERDLTDTGLVDEILEEGLSKRERKLGI